MKDFDKLIKECEADLASVGISIGNVVKYSVNTRAKSRWGQCKTVGENRYEINISQSLLEDNVSDQAAKDTILHEMLHTVEGGMGHKGKWKELAQRVNKELPQYTIKRVTSREEKGIESEKPPLQPQKSSVKAKKKQQCGDLARNLPFFLSVACIVAYLVVLALCLLGTRNGLNPDEKAVLLISKGYLPWMIMLSLLGMALSVASVKKSESQALAKASSIFCLLFFLLLFLSINIVLN